METLKKKIITVFGAPFREQATTCFYLLQKTGISLNYQENDFEGDPGSDAVKSLWLLDRAKSEYHYTGTSSNQNSHAASCARCAFAYLVASFKLREYWELETDFLKLMPMTNIKIFLSQAKKIALESLYYQAKALVSPAEQEI